MTVQGQVFGTCDLHTGQCTCSREAIIGRTCDHCAPGTKSNISLYNINTYLAKNNKLIVWKN